MPRRKRKSSSDEAGIGSDHDPLPRTMASHRRSDDQATTLDGEHSDADGAYTLDEPVAETTSLT